MMTAKSIGLLPPSGTAMIGNRVKYATFLALCLIMECAGAQQQPEPKRDDLDVTMQIIVDPDAKLPDEVVRRIPLPERKANPPQADPGNKTAKPDAAAEAAENNERAREAKDVGREMGQNARERATEAAEQREEARRSAAEERERERDRDRDPGPPANPPGRPPRD
jgi:hypothetical protein